MIREKRDSRLTADISETAHNMLKEAVIKFDSSKGKLVEKMIHSFLGEKEAAPATQVAVVEKPKTKTKRKVFKPPTVDEVREYCDSRCNDVDPQKFVSHYTANGWVRGKAETKIKCWKSCVQTWEGNNKPAVKVEENLGGNW